MPRWETKIVDWDRTHQILNDVLNKEGNDGWEFADIDWAGAPVATHIIFKREITDSPAEPSPLACFKEIPTIPLQSPAAPQQTLTEHDLHPPERCKPPAQSNEDDCDGPTVIT